MLYHELTQTQSKSFRQRLTDKEEKSQLAYLTAIPKEEGAMSCPGN